MKLFFLLLTFSFSAIAGLEGRWTSGNASIRAYSYDRTVDYENCPGSFELHRHGDMLMIAALASRCEHDSYFTFNEKLPMQMYAIAADGKLFAQNGRSVGHYDGSSLELRHDLEGEVLYLEASLNANNALRLDWYRRGMDVFSFDFQGSFKAAK
jgi:hypothetical protein